MLNVIYLKKWQMSLPPLPTMVKIQELFSWKVVKVPLGSQKALQQNHHYFSTTASTLTKLNILMGGHLYLLQR